MSTTNFKRQQTLFSPKEQDLTDPVIVKINLEKSKVRQEAEVNLELESAQHGCSRRLHFLLAILCLASLAPLGACQSSNAYKPSEKDPYAMNAPKTKEEEAYYQDVYSGEWKEQTNPFGFGKAIGKKNGSTSMPSHWATIPNGAKSMSEIRAENQAREMALAGNGNQQQQMLQMQQMQAQQIQQQQSSPYPPQSALVNGNIPQSYLPGAAPAPITVAQNGYTPYTPNASAGNVNNTGNVNPVQNNVPNNAIVPGQSNVPLYKTNPVNNSGVNPSQSSNYGASSDSNIIIRGQMPLQHPVPLQNQKSLRSRMRQDYFADEPLRLAQASVPQSIDKILPPDKKQVTPKNTSATTASTVSPTVHKVAQANPTSPATQVVQVANQATPVSQDNMVPQRIGGTVRPLKVDPQLANSNIKNKVSDTASFTKVHEGKQAVSQFEYITDGGDRKGEAYSSPDWKVHHLDSEDTVAHFDTIEGKILVEPSNRVRIYSPRFGSVRQILGPSSNQSKVTLVDAQGQTKVSVEKEIKGTDVRSGEETASLARDDKTVAGAQSDTFGDTASGQEYVMENTLETRIGDMVSLLKSNSISDKERPLLMGGTQAAQAWGELQAVDVHIDSLNARSNVYNQGAEVLFTVENGTKSSQLSLIKIASKKSAQPGELIEFTLRYQNVGNQPIGNVTILDSLSPRLEYVENSAKSSRKGDFLTEPNESGSQILRWEISEPLPKGEFGIIQFLCRVR